MPFPGAALAAKGGFKLGKFLVNQGRAAWGRAKESGFQLTTGQTAYSRKASGTSSASAAASYKSPEAYNRAMSDLDAGKESMDYMKYAPYAIGVLLLLMMKK